MLAIWCLVEEERHIRGAKSIVQACERVFQNRCGGLIKFIERDGVIVDLIKGTSGPDTLRQRYYAAEKCRHDSEKYPYLHGKALSFLTTMSGRFSEIKAIEAEMRWHTLHNKWKMCPRTGAYLDAYPG